MINYQPQQHNINLIYNNDDDDDDDDVCGRWDLNP